MECPFCLKAIDGRSVVCCKPGASRIPRLSALLAVSCLILSTSCARVLDSVSTDAEARALAPAIWEKVLTKCRDRSDSSLSYYLRDDSGFDGGFEGPRIVQYKSVSFAVLPAEPLTPADLQNGIQSRAVALMYASVFRDIADPAKGRFSRDPDWRPWRDGPAFARAKHNQAYLSSLLGHEQNGGSSGSNTILMTKVNGQWAYSVDVNAIASERFSCAEIPGTGEYEIAQRRKSEADAVAKIQQEEEARKKEKEDQKSRVEEERKRGLAQAAGLAARLPQTDLEKMTQSNGFWTDPHTHLTWMARDQRACGRQNIGGYTDWRVAGITELKSLYDPARSHDFVSGIEVLQYHVAGGIMLSQSVVWASASSFAWGFDFSSGERISRMTVVNNSLLCVRGTPMDPPPAAGHREPHAGMRLVR